MEEKLRDGSHNNAMAECALAPAMAFFSIMVLTMVSMGAGVETNRTGTPFTSERISIRPSTPSAAPAIRREADDTDDILIHYRGRFYDRTLELLMPDAARSEGRTILAIDPALSLVEAIAVRQRIADPDLIVTTLDERWLGALKELSK